jgi:hypothetical protein
LLPKDKPFYRDLEAVLTVSGAAFLLVSIGDLAGVVFRLFPLDAIAVCGGVLAFVPGFVLALMGQPSKRQGQG